MTTVTINTSQNVAIKYPIASIGSRLLAMVLDYIFIFAYLILMGLIIDKTKLYKTDNYWIFTIMFLPVIFYHLTLEILFNGQSFGKMITKIKVVKADGSQAGVGSYFLRWLIGLIEINLTSGVVALLAILFNGKGQRIGDIAANTRVISINQKPSVAKTIIQPSAFDNTYEVVFPQVKKLSDNDIEIVNKAYKKALKSNNWSIIKKTSEKLKSVLNINTPLTDKEFIETILKDYSHIQFK